MTSRISSSSIKVLVVMRVFDERKYKQTSKRDKEILKGIVARKDEENKINKHGINRIKET